MVSASFSYNLVYFCNKSQILEVSKVLSYAHKRLFLLRSARRKCALITGVFVRAIYRKSLLYRTDGKRRKRHKRF